jgi:hypothetical protein
MDSRHLHISFLPPFSASFAEAFTGLHVNNYIQLLTGGGFLYLSVLRPARSTFFAVLYTDTFFSYISNFLFGLAQPVPGLGRAFCFSRLRMPAIEPAVANESSNIIKVLIINQSKM